jgi:hypothetical protein
MGNVLSRIVCLLVLCIGAGAHLSAWNTVRLTDCRWLRSLDCHRLELLPTRLLDCDQLELPDCRQLEFVVVGYNYSMLEVICSSAGRQVYVNDHPT